MKSINRLLDGLAVAFPFWTSLTAFAFGLVWLLAAYAAWVVVLGLAATTAVRLTLDRRKASSAALVTEEVMVA